MGSVTNDGRSTQSFDRDTARTNTMPARTTSAFESPALERFNARKAGELNNGNPTRLKKQHTEPALHVSSTSLSSLIKSEKISKGSEPVRDVMDSSRKKTSTFDEPSSLEKIRQRRQELIEKKAEIAERKSGHLEKKRLEHVVFLRLYLDRLGRR